MSQPAVAPRSTADALRAVLADALEADPRVVLLGESVGRLGGIHRVTEGLLEQFGAQRVIDTPLSERGAVGLAVGLSLGGKLPVVELSVADRSWAAAEQLLQELATLAGRTSELAAPLVLRLPCGAAGAAGPFVGGAVESLLTSAPGLAVVCGSTPADAAGLLRSALAAKTPVVLLEPMGLYATRAPLTRDPVPLASARTVREGDHCTVLCWGDSVGTCADAAEALAEHAYGVEVVDLRSLQPLDLGAIGASVRKTGRVLVVHEGGPAFADRVLRAATREAFLSLEAPPATVGGLPTVDAVARAVVDAVQF